MQRIIAPFVKPIARIRIPSPPHGLRIAVIPDGQVHPGVPLDHWSWCGKYLALKRPDVIVQLGDFTDLPSLSTHDTKGSLQLEGKRYQQDIDYSRKAMDLFLTPIYKVHGWRPSLYLTLGNHEHRIIRTVNEDPKLEGLINISDLKYEQYGWHVYPFLQPIIIGGVAFCLTPEHKVLTSDLQYVMLGDIKPGDKLLAFDELGNRRQYKTSIVLASDPARAPVFAVTLSSGKVFNVTADHQWLVCRKGTCQVWRPTTSLPIGSKVPRFFNEWSNDTTFEAGWLSGMLDGEGCLSAAQSNYKGGLNLDIGQNEGPILNKLMSLLTQKGIPYSLHDNGVNTRCRKLRLTGQTTEKLQALGQFRPQRLLDKFYPEYIGQMWAIAYDTVINIEPIGIKEIQMIETSTKTMIVEGYGHHNCHYFPSGVMGRPITSAKALLAKLHMSTFAGHQQGRDIAFAKRADGVDMTAIISGSFYQHAEEYLSPFTNNHWRGMFMLHETKDGSYNEMAVSINYLKRRFGK